MDRVRGRVVVAGGKHYEVVTPGGRLECVLRGVLKKERPTSVDPVAVGDWVEVTPGPGGTGAIGAVEPRATKFSRPSPGRPAIEQVIVANATRMVVCQSADLPPVKSTSIDRYLVAAELGGLDAVLCINKMDLDRTGEAARIGEEYRRLGFEVFFVAATRCEGTEALGEALREGMSVLAGPSGVGKSTILNCIQPGLGLRVREVSQKWARGKHTTSGVALFELDKGGWVADTPGLRELGLWGVGETDLREYFHEFDAFAQGCRYSTCTHSHEPECAVVAAVESGRVSRRRYDSYLRILEKIRDAD